jgi:hypothetical protein
MGTGKSDVIAAGKWLARQREDRGDKCSGTLVARAALARARVQGDPINITQQQLSAIENATEDRGPAKLPPWWRHVRGAFESGEVDDLLLAPTTKAGDRTGLSAGGELLIHTRDGELVGRIILERAREG